ncbi:hypothetical protein YB2330_001576 [Saitoella coloradoensis]
MPVPFESLIPMGIIAGLFAVTGGLLAASKQFQNEGKPPRYGIDTWDRQMMERDQRLTGTMRGQSQEPRAPAEFAVNSAWKIES